MIKGAKEARNQLPHLLDEAETGRSTVIAKHGRPVAALVPIEAYDAAVRQEPLRLSPDLVAGFGAR
jgi:prevent-host-death family protein